MRLSDIDHVLGMDKKEIILTFIENDPAMEDMLGAFCACIMMTALSDKYEDQLDGYSKAIGYLEIIKHGLMNQLENLSYPDRE